MDDKENPSECPEYVARFSGPGRYPVEVLREIPPATPLDICTVCGEAVKWSPLIVAYMHVEHHAFGTWHSAVVARERWRITKSLGRWWALMPGCSIMEHLADCTCYRDPSWPVVLDHARSIA